MSKEYKELLPVNNHTTVKQQFGFLPLSIFKPKPRPDWDKLINDDGDETTRRSKNAKYLPNLRFSKFHPDVAEFCIKYWSLENDLIVDPFSGRQTRAVVSLTLNRKYEAYEIANSTYNKTKNAIKELGGILHNSDGCKMKHTKDNSADLIFTCPPYHNIEKYESCDNQLSDLKDYQQFLNQIYIACENSFRVLKDGRFAVWVVGDWRDGKGYKMFHSDLAQLMKKAGFDFWDIVILHNNSPFAALQAGKVAAKRYTSKIHEYIMVFKKPGDFKLTKEQINNIKGNLSENLDDLFI